MVQNFVNAHNAKVAGLIHDPTLNPMPGVPHIQVNPGLRPPIAPQMQNPLANLMNPALNQSIFGGQVPQMNAVQQQLALLQKMNALQQMQQMQV